MCQLEAVYALPLLNPMCFIENTAFSTHNPTSRAPQRFDVGLSFNLSRQVVYPYVSISYVSILGSSLFSVGNLVRQFGLCSAALRLFKVESDINGILPAGGGPLPFISFLP